MHFNTAILVASLIYSDSLVSAHIAAFGPGMFCKNGLSGDNFNNNDVVAPLYQLSKKDFWFQHDRGCDTRPPPKDEYLDIPAGGSFTVQLANNQAFTDLSYDGSMASVWPDGKDHPEDWHGQWDGAECLPGGGWLHAQNETMAQGTAFAISYSNDISKVTLDNLVVFSVLQHSPWKSSATYQVPKELEECPEGGCTCSWLWVPKGCGQANMYMQGFKCRVTNVDKNVSKPLQNARAAKWCKEDTSKCVQGAKQMIIFNQMEGNNVEGIPQYETPVYNEACGYKSGAQNDIFDSSAVPVSSRSITSTSSASFSALSTLSTVIRHIVMSTPGNSATTTISSTIDTLSASQTIKSRQSSAASCPILAPVTVTETVTSIITATPSWTRW